MKIPALASVFVLGLGLGTLLPAAEPAPVPGDERLDRIEQRLDRIERSLAQLLQQSQTPPAAAPNPAAAPEAPAPATPEAAKPTADSVVTLAPLAEIGAVRPGVVLDIWSRPSRFKGGVPTIPSLSTLVDTRAPFFSLGRPADDKELGSNSGKPLILVWRGLLKVNQAGAHVLLAEFRRTTAKKSVAKSQPWDDFLFAWAAQLTLNDRVLLDETNKFESAGKGTLTRTFTLDLQPGYYAVELVTWLPAQPAEEVYDYKPLVFGLRLREPGAAKPRDLGPADFVCVQ